MATYGAQPQSTQKPNRGINTPSGNKQADGGLFSDLFSSLPSPKNLKVPQKDLLVFFRQLAVILQSGVPLAQGLLLIADNMTNQRLAGCVQHIAARLSAGEELSLSLKLYPKVFEPLAVGLIEAGEAGGILEQVLDRVALLLEERAKIRGQIIGALIYPVIVLVLATTVSLGLLIFIVPRFKTMFDGMGAELPALTSFLLDVSKAITTLEFAIGAPVTLILIVIVFNRYYSTAKGRYAIDKLILKVPLFGDLILRSEMASMSDTLATLVNAGIPIVEGLERCIAASSNELTRRTLIQGISMVQQGQELNYSLGRSGMFPKLVISMIKIGEETGQLSFMLEKLAMFYKREVESTVTSLTKAMEPAVVFVVAGIVGTIVIALYLPMFSLITNMRG
ncbi:type II secretion system F family protein [Synechococcus sp. YX-04-1]|uniref:type II secretion system F family protein n=1 Tax=Synechococcus sp. YX-04-1 TaxID=3062778 RepID=UPI0026E15375|nr:type II secretion system F family protein [Synechococcus sp. YX-04-1]MDO6351462.1 type II secretion system F family protein [Synechococcus sp. YX-04-1]